jgi:hypothetical protein
VGRENGSLAPGTSRRDSPDRRGELGDGVLGRHCVVMARGVKGPALLGLQNPGGVRDGSGGLEEALGVLGVAHLVRQ